MLVELGVVLQGMVEAIVGSAALFACQGRARNQQSGLQDVGRLVRSPVA